MSDSPSQCNCRTRRGFHPVRMLFQIALLYVVLVFGGGTLVRTGNPVAVELGRLMHTVTLVQPAIHWADSRDYDALAGGLRTLSDGVGIG